MLEILQRGMNIVDRVRGMDIQSEKAVILFGALLVFGAVNCILGYRLLRFWMMLFGFVLGAGGGLFGAWQFGVQEKIYYLAAASVCGIIVAVIAFLSYKAGIFIIGAGLGLCLGIYVIHPTSSQTFFLCILAGVGLGILALRFERGVIIVGTSLLGGVLAGFSTAKLLGMSDLPYGILMCAGYAILGMLLQFAINRPVYEDDEDDEEEFGQSRRAGRTHRPSGNRQHLGDDFDEREYRRIYESLDEEDIEEAYLREKVLNEESSDPVEDFIDEKIEGARERRNKKKTTPAAGTQTQRRRRSIRSDRNTEPEAEKTGRRRRPADLHRDTEPEAEKTSRRHRLADPHRDTEPEAEKTGRRRKSARPGRITSPEEENTAAESDTKSKGTRAGHARKQVDFRLTGEDEMADAHQKAWEQKKRTE